MNTYNAICIIKKDQLTLRLFLEDNQEVQNMCEHAYTHREREREEHIKLIGILDVFYLSSLT